MYANWAVKDRRDAGRPFLFIVYIAVVHVLLAIGKLSAFFFLIVPGVYLYVKLLFVSLIMLEQKKGALSAIKTSWMMTSGNFWRLFLLVVINALIQFVAVITIVGVIPATGFVNTARAAAFRMLLRQDDHVET